MHHKLPLLPLLLVVGFLFGNGPLRAGLTVSGYVEDAQTGERLIGARVVDVRLSIGALTNDYGFFSITTESDQLELTASFLGYAPQTLTASGSGNQSLRFRLSPNDTELETVEITAEESIAESALSGTIDVPIEQIKSLPALLGEVDVIKALQMLPGVQSGSEGSSGLFVRGGTPDQNLILLDGVPLYNVQHLFGFFSVFNADALKSVTLVKSGFPARYGGRLSSVLDIHMKEGDLQEFHGSGSIGLISSRLTFEGPIQKGKTSFLVSGRRTYLDLIGRPLVRSLTNGNTAGGYYFYDFNAKVNHILSDKDRIYLSGYFGRDQFDFALRDEVRDPNGDFFRSESGFDLGWGNAIGALRWNHLFGPKLFSNLTLGISDYDYSAGGRVYDEQSNAGAFDYDSTSFAYISRIRDLNARMDLEWFARPEHLVRFGGYAIHHRFSPEASNIRYATTGATPVDTTYGNQRIPALETGVYLEDELRIGHRFRANPGLHFSAFRVDEGWYSSLQPRLSARYLVSDEWAVKGSYARMAQFIHLLSNASIGLPTDLWVPATRRIPPQDSWIASLGVARRLERYGLDLSVDAYFKQMNNVIEYKEGVQQLLGGEDIEDQVDGYLDELERAGRFWEGRIEVGQGWSYGAEILLQKKAGRTSGWVGYTLSWTQRRFERLNDGRVFPYKYDRRHDFSVALTHQWKPRIKIGLNYVYGSGYAVTLPVAFSATAQPSPVQPPGGLGQVQTVTSRNNHRLRDYHRLDLGIHFTKEKPKWSRTWSVGVYNVYSRLNTFFLTQTYDPLNQRTSLRRLSLFPVLPSVSYQFKF